MIRFLSIFLCISLSLQGMDTQLQPDLTPTLPDEVTYTIIDLWPALNVYRLISKRWHALTSYTHADDIVGKLGAASLGNWDAQKLLSKYKKNNDLKHASIVLARKQLKCDDEHNDFKSDPYHNVLSPEMKALLERYGIHNLFLDETQDNLICQAASQGDLQTIRAQYTSDDGLPASFPPCLRSVQMERDYFNAVANNQIDVVKKLVAAQNNHHELVLNNALTIAIENDHIAIVDFLLGKLSYDDISYTSYYTVAADSADRDTVEKLCQKSVTHINDTNYLKGSPFMQAIAHGRLEIAKLLKKHGADIHRYHEEHGLPLYHACWKGRGEAVEFLLANGIKPDSVYKNGFKSFTPLWVAASENHLEIAQKLIAAGANVDWGANKHAPDTYDSIEPIPTPLIQAAYKGNLEMVQLLVKAGAQVWNPQFNGKNAQETARAQGHMHIVNWLQEHAFKA